MLAAGSWPDWLSAVSGPQERVQQHTVEQMVDCVPGLPVPDAPVPQVEHPHEARRRAGDLEDGAPLRAVLREPRVAEQLVDVPVPHTVILAHGRDDRASAGATCWEGVAVPIGGWSAPTTKKDRPQGFTASPGRCTNTGQLHLPGS